MELESTVSPRVTVGNKCKAGGLERRKVVSSALVTAQTSPNWRGLEGFGVAVVGLEDDHVVVVTVAFCASFGSEETDVEGNVDVRVGRLDVPSALTATAVKSRVVLRLDLVALSAHRDCVGAVAHEEGRLEVVIEPETLAGARSV